MKIAVFHNLPVGGAKRVLYEQVKSLSKKHAITVFTYKQNSNKYFDLGKYAEVKKFNSGVELNKHRIIKDLQTFIFLKRNNKFIAKKINKDFDVCLLHTDYFIDTPFLARYLSIPYLYYDQEILARVYSKDFEFKENVNIIKYFYEMANRLVRKNIDFNNYSYIKNVATNSKYMKDHIRTIYKKDSTIISPGVDQKIFKPNIGNRKGYLFVGNKSKDEGWHFLSGILNIKTLNKDGKNMSIKTDKGMSLEYSSVKATICTNTVEAFGLKAIESMACGTPVIAINEAAYPELIIDGKNGFLTKRSEIKKAIKKLESLSADEYKKMSKFCVEYSKNFDWKSHNKKLENLLLSLAND